MCQREWADVHYSLSSIELEPLRKGSTLIFMSDFPANSNAQVWEPTHGEINESLPQRRRSEELRLKGSSLPVSSIYSPRETKRAR